MVGLEPWSVVDLEMDGVDDGGCGGHGKLKLVVQTADRNKICKEEDWRVIFRI